MNNSKSNQRRKLLKSAAIGGGLIGASQFNTERWIKPVIQSVLLPAHAATTDDAGNLSSGASLLLFSLTEVSNNDSVMLNGSGERETYLTAGRMLQKLFITDAQAGIAPPPTSTTTREYYLGQVSGNLYHFVSLSTTTRDGSVVDTYLIEGDISVGETKQLPTAYCGTADDTASVELVNATAGGSAMVKIYGGKLTAELFIDPNATPPVEGSCIAT